MSLYLDLVVPDIPDIHWPTIVFLLEDRCLTQTALIKNQHTKQKKAKISKIYSIVKDSNADLTVGN